MRRSSAYLAALRTAFARSTGASPAGAKALVVRIRTPAFLFVAGFPGGIGAVSLAAALSRGGTSDGAFPLAVAGLVSAAVLLVLGLRSRLSVRADGVTVRFYGLRGTTVRFSDLRSATFGMAFPSISFAITLTDHHGRKALLHANWWNDEANVLSVVCRALVEQDVAMDRSAARIVSRVLAIKRPAPRIVHRALFRKDRTW
jgi:hypothetical protein